MKKFALLVLAASVILMASSAFASPVCPNIGAGGGCGVIIDVTAVDGSGNATAFTATLTGVGPFDGVEDTLVGLSNSSGATLYNLHLFSSDTTYGGLFFFDGDGSCAYGGGCYDSTGYAGPDNTFANYSSFTSGDVVFASGIADGGTSWFSLEGTPNSLAGVAPTPEPASLVLFGSGLLGLAGLRRRKK